MNSKKVYRYVFQYGGEVAFDSSDIDMFSPAGPVQINCHRALTVTLLVKISPELDKLPLVSLSSSLSAG
jgi:hypothetical protein